MRARHPLFALAGLATALAAPQSAPAAGVYGGTTRAGDAIVLETDRPGKRLESAVLSWRAECEDGDGYPVSVDATVSRPAPGFEPGPNDLVMRRNRGRRFAGAVTQVHSLGGDLAGFVSGELRGRLRARRASGTFRGTASVIDIPSGEEITTCTTGSVRWSASRAPGRVFGGATSQEEPIVIRASADGHRLDRVYFGWQAQDCEPPGAFLRLSDGAGGFAVDRRGRWGDSWENEFDHGADGMDVLAYELHGSLGRRSASGMLEVTYEHHDVAGVTELSCATGTVDWKAATG